MELFKILSVVCGMDRYLFWTTVLWDISFKYVCLQLIFTMQKLHDKWEWQATTTTITNFKMTNLNLNLKLN